MLAISNQLKGTGYEIFTAPFDVRFSADENTDTVVQPDLSIFCGKNQLDEKGATAAPKWVIEILSPETALRYHDKKCIISRE